MNRNFSFLNNLWIYDQIKRSKDNKPHLSNVKSRAMETLETKQIQNIGLFHQNQMFYGIYRHFLLESTAVGLPSQN